MNGALRNAAAENNQSFYIYGDRDSGLNHFVPSRFTNGGETLSVKTDAIRASSDTAIEVTWNGAGGVNGQRWNGVGFEDVAGHFNSQRIGPGYSIFDTGIAPAGSRLVFDAKIATKDVGDHVEFGYAEIGDSTTSVRNWIALSTNWATYSFDVSGKNLSNIHQGFIATANDVHDVQRNGVKFYLDNIRYEWARPNEPRLVTSYVVQQETGDIFDRSHANTAYVYDQIVTSMALSLDRNATGTTLAQRVIEGVASAMTHDWTNDPGARPAPDGPVRTGLAVYEAYMGGDPLDHKTGNARPTGWYNEDPSLGQTQQWFIHNYGLDGGVNLWTALGMLKMWQQTGQIEYLDNARKIAEWVEVNLKDSAGGFRLGWKSDGTGGWQWMQDIKSVEHSIDAYSVYARLAGISHQQGDSVAEQRWRADANHAAAFVLTKMYDPIEGRFYTGTNADGSLNATHLAVDVQAWAVLSLGTRPEYAQAIDWKRPLQWAEANLSIRTAAGLGYDFGYDRTVENAPDGIWIEGTSQMALAWLAVGETAKYQELMDTIRTFVGSNSGLVSAGDRPNISTGITLADGSVWEIQQRRAIASTAWIVLAAQAYNPFWNDTLVPAAQIHPMVIVPDGVNPSLVLRSRDGWLQLVDVTTNQHLFDQPLAATRSLTIIAHQNTPDTLRIELGDQPWTLPDGVIYFAGQSSGDRVTLVGNSSANTFQQLGTTLRCDDLNLRIISVEQTELVGQSGNDIYAIAVQNTRVHVIDTAGIDTFDFSRMQSGVTLYLERRGAPAQNLGSSRVALSFQGSIENVIGSRYNDVLLGSSLNNRLEGRGGNDQLRGYGGNDILTGGTGNDVLMGGLGDDVLIGGAGTDKIFGEAGDDFFVTSWTIYDLDGEALLAIQQAWLTPGTLAQRQRRLLDNVGPVRMLERTTWFDDGVIDYVYSGGGFDWHVDATADRRLLPRRVVA